MAEDKFRKFARGLGFPGTGVDMYRKHVSNSYINPTIVEERHMNVAVMDVFSRLMMDRIVYLGTEIDFDICNIISAQLLYLDSKSDHKKPDEDEITMIINSPGGVIYAGLGIYDTMQLISSDIRTRCSGLAASMASVLLTAGTKGKRESTQNSRIMIHQSYGSYEGVLSDVKIQAKEQEDLQNVIDNILSTKTGNSIDQIKADCNRDYFMSAQDAKAYGLIDIVL